METQTGISFIPSTPLTDDDMAAVEQDYRDHRAARWSAWPNFERTRSYKQDVALAAAEAFMAANPVDETVCISCRNGDHAGCLPTGNCTCCQREAVAA